MFTLAVYDDSLITTLAVLLFFFILIADNLLDMSSFTALKKGKVSKNIQTTTNSNHLIC